MFAWDASDYDWSRGPMDLGAAFRAGVHAFTHKATEGTSIRHGRTGEALSRAGRAGIPYLGAYAVPRTPGSHGHGPVAAQVDYAIGWVDECFPQWRTHPGWFWQVDLEKWSYDPVPAVVGAQMADLFAERTGRPVLLYAPRWAYGDSIPGERPLWASEYGKNPAEPYLDAYRAAGGDTGPGWRPYSGRTPLLWQFGSRTTIGTQSNCDASAIRDVAAWTALFVPPRPAPAPVPTPLGDDDMPAALRYMIKAKAHPEIFMVTRDGANRTVEHMAIWAEVEAAKAAGVTYVDDADEAAYALLRRDAGMPAS